MNQKQTKTIAFCGSLKPIFKKSIENTYVYTYQFSDKKEDSEWLSESE